MSALLLLLAATAFGQDYENLVTEPWDTWGDLRWVGVTLSEFPVDADGTESGQKLWLDQRIRLGFGRDQGTWGFKIEGDVLTGQAAGDTWDLGSEDDRHRDERGAWTLDGLSLRKAYVQGYVGNVHLMGGLMTSHWGTGMLVNDGDHEREFGYTQLGDRMFRVRATLFPDRKATPGRGSTAVSFAADLVLDDGIAVLARNEWAGQLIAAAMHTRATGAEYGVYGVFRHQVDLDTDRYLTVGVADIYVDYPAELGSWTLTVKGEGLGIAGATDRSTSYNSPDKLIALQVGANGSIDLSKDFLSFRLRSGYASGDGDPDDKFARDFVYDNNVGVGMVLFDQFMGAVDQQTYNIVNDPANLTHPPDGSDLLVREGSFRSAVYAMPLVEVRPVEGLHLKAGVMGAWSTNVYAHPWYSTRAGGVPYNQYDVPTQGRHLGTEIDWSAGFSRKVVKNATPSFQVQGGHLALGKALQGAGPNWVHSIQGTARFQW